MMIHEVVSLLRGKRACNALDRGMTCNALSGRPVMPFRVTCGSIIFQFPSLQFPIGAITITGDIEGSSRITSNNLIGSLRITRIHCDLWF
ncbi:hypothetical protein L1987_12460 [Smallanthus sonchifolius]|uniref:Uncharacterized protein n=1 Tax=Smallanthus sonchifolius TaxID=185202 RepID=A0ACB9JGG4_9ASTR|nr:hypothetical protein L1987_12460 [Smallanthus sonchifolius]